MRLFGGGFGAVADARHAARDRRLRRPVLLLCQACSSTCSTGWSGGCTGGAGTVRCSQFNFAFFVGGGALAALVAKYQALAYFSDAMSFQIVRNLGGGSLVDALKYSLSEAGLMLIARRRGLALLCGGLPVAAPEMAQGAAARRTSRGCAMRTLIALLAATPFAAVRRQPGRRRRAALGRFNSVIADRDRARLGDRLRPRRLELVLLPDRRQPFDAGRHPLCARHARRRHRPGRLWRRLRLFGRAPRPPRPRSIAGAQAATSS